MTSAIKAQGTILRYAGSPSVKLEEATSVKPGGTSVNAIDASHLESTAKEFLAGLKDSGTIDWVANFTNQAGQQAMRRDFDAGNTANWEIYFGGAAAPVTLSFSGFQTKYDGPEANVDNKLTISGSIKVTGPITVV